MHPRSRTLVTSLLLASLAATAPVAALPPGETSRGFVDGANHHLGDASFEARYGRAPTARDTESTRMHAHLTHVRRSLAERPATRPELAARRAQLLGYLDDYIAAGTTPWNLSLPWRNPVFVDEFGNVCAVGYLIERSEGRALVERIARAHRYDYLEDIAMPEVRAWIANSGFTLEELASIQPGYVAPIVDQWQVWDLPARRPADGAFAHESEGIRTTGTWQRGEMEGAWSRTDAAGHTLGSGTFRAGRGAWRSRYATGETLAEGNFERSHPHGAWRFFHPSGRVAAEGAFAHGNRDGAWRFYYDDAAQTPIAQGRFNAWGLAGRWRHYDASGRLVAESWTAQRAPVPQGFAANAIRFARTPQGLDHEVHQANIDGDHHRLDALRLNGTRLYVRSRGDDALYDDEGHQLTPEGDHWLSGDCHWSRATRRAARNGQLAVLHGLLVERGEVECDAGVRVSPERAARINAVIAPLATTRVPSPAFVRSLVLGDDPSGDSTEPATDSTERPAVARLTGPRRADDLTDVLAANMTWYVEWPHVDGRFLRVFATLPDHFAPGTLGADSAVLPVGFQTD